MSVDDKFIIGLGCPSDKKALALATRKGDHIPNVRRQEQLPQRLAAAVHLWTKEKPDAELRSITATYNCMGMVFGCRRTWIDPQHLTLILNGDGYEKLASIWDAERGDVAVYKNNCRISHVGIIMRVDSNLPTADKALYILSQWGSDGEWFHPHHCVPDAFGQLAEVWTDRKKIRR